jgi:hypothetical protein
MILLRRHPRAVSRVAPFARPGPIGHVVTYDEGLTEGALGRVEGKSCRAPR